MCVLCLIIINISRFLEICTFNYTADYMKTWCFSTHNRSVLMLLITPGIFSKNNITNNAIPKINIFFLCMVRTRALLDYSRLIKLDWNIPERRLISCHCIGRNVMINFNVLHPNSDSFNGTQRFPATNNKKSSFSCYGCNNAILHT